MTALWQEQLQTHLAGMPVPKIKQLCQVLRLPQSGGKEHMILQIEKHVAAMYLRGDDDQVQHAYLLIGGNLARPTPPQGRVAASDPGGNLAEMHDVLTNQERLKDTDPSTVQALLIARENLRDVAGLVGQRVCAELAKAPPKLKPCEEAHGLIVNVIAQR